MEIIIIAFHIFFVVSIVLLIQAIAERKKARALEANKTEATKTAKQSVQLVHDGLANVVSHLTSIEGLRPDLPLAEISASATEDNGVKHCPNCKTAWDNAFDFCLKCSQAGNK